MLRQIERREAKRARSCATARLIGRVANPIPNVSTPMPARRREIELDAMVAVITSLVGFLASIVAACTVAASGNIQQLRGWTQ